MSADDGTSDFPFDQPKVLPEKQVAIISLREQSEEAHRELTRRHRSYAGQVKHGKMTETEAAAGIAVARTIRDTLRLFAEFEPELREWLKVRIAERKLKDHPAVKAVKNAVPGAEVVSVRQMHTFTGDAPSGLLDEGETEAANDGAFA